MNEAEVAAGLVPTPGYRHADVVGDELFVAGPVPLDAAGGLVAPGDAGAQATRCLDTEAFAVVGWTTICDDDGTTGGSTGSWNEIALISPVAEEITVVGRGRVAAVHRAIGWRWSVRVGSCTREATRRSPCRSNARTP